MSKPVTIRRPSCRQPEGIACVSAGRRGNCSLCLPATLALFKASDHELMFRRARTRARQSVRWTLEMDMALIELRSKRKGIHHCAEHIGVDSSIVIRRLAELGLPRLARGGHRNEAAKERP